MEKLNVAIADDNERMLRLLGEDMLSSQWYYQLPLYPPFYQDG